MNLKAVMVVFVFQVVVGILWYASTPTQFLGRSVFHQEAQLPSWDVLTIFFCSSFVFLWFTAWLLVRVGHLTRLGQFLLVIFIWLFIVLPNFMIVALHLELDYNDSVYLLSYSAVNCAIMACILPLWRPSRSIFKD
ncbi:hypothetical protein [Marinomonas sp. THO17]|uniref:hypothetical protein n=1 Tax=Marinomonas sp. THO17 TaxID=3149048 RepID=UPI00336BBC09